MNNTSPKRMFYHRYAKKRVKQIKSDPISTVMRASMMAKFDQICDTLSAFCNKKSSINNFASAKGSFSVSKSKAAPERKSKCEVGLQRTSRSLTNRQSTKTQHKRKQSYISLTSFQTNSTEKRLQLLTKIKSTYQPSSSSNIREMLIKRSIKEFSQNKDLMENPYYKIMKKRVKTQYNLTNRQLCQSVYKLGQQEQPRIQGIKTQCLTEPNQREETQEICSKIDDQDNEFIDKNYQGNRQRNTTKIYQEIKQYFEEKYGKCH